MREPDPERGRRRGVYLVVLGGLAMAGGFVFTYYLEYTHGWSLGRRIGGSLLFGAWCAFMVTLTRVGGAFR